MCIRDRTDTDLHLDDDHVEEMGGVENIEESHEEHEEVHEENGESHDEHTMDDFSDMRHAHDMEEFLFGSILNITPENVITILVLCVVILVILKLIYKKLLYTTFSEEQARVSGIPVEKINYLLIGMSGVCLLYTSPSPRDLSTSRMPSSA